MLRSTSTKLALTGLIAAAAVALAPSAALAASPRCEAKEGDTVARNTTTRVFMRTTGTVDDGQDVRIYSCRLGTRTAVLTTRFRNDLDGELRLQEAILGSSKYLGIVFEELTGTSDSTDVFLYDLSVPDRRYFTFNRDGTREGLQAVVTRNGGLCASSTRASSPSSTPPARGSSGRRARARSGGASARTPSTGPPARRRSRRC